MTARGATKGAILNYIRVDNEPIAMHRIARYMMRTFGTSAPAVANQLRALIKAGAIRRVGRGLYQVSA